MRDGAWLLLDDAKETRQMKIKVTFEIETGRDYSMDGIPDALFEAIEQSAKQDIFDGDKVEIRAFSATEAK
jgi:hypothetical protein